LFIAPFRGVNYTDIKMVLGSGFSVQGSAPPLAGKAASLIEIETFG
jgi:hypothetical protein